MHFVLFSAFQHGLEIYAVGEDRSMEYCRVNFPEAFQAILDATP